MQVSKTKFTLSGRKAAKLQQTGLRVPVENADHVRAIAQKFGVGMDSAALYNAVQAANAAAAMDSNYNAPLTTPSVTTPIQFLQNWLPGTVNVVTRARKIDTLVGISTVGAWEDEEIVQRFAERTGSARPYLDDTNVQFSNWNMNFERRTIVRFEEGMQVTRLAEMRASRMDYSDADAKRTGAALALEVQRNYVGFYGYNNGLGRTYGLLNEPSLPAYVNLPNGAAGSSQWAQKTTLEIIADILAAAQSLRTQSGDLIDVRNTPTTFATGTSVIDYLARPTELGYSVMEWAARYFPQMRFESAPEFDAANGGANVFYLYAEDFGDESTDDGRVIIQMVPAKFMTVGVQQQVKGYVEDYANATAGVMVKRPWAIRRYSGC